MTVARRGDRGAELRAEHLPPDQHGLLQQAAQVLALEREPAEAGDGGLLREVALELRLGLAQALAGPVERLGGAADLVLHQVEGARELTDLVARAHDDGDDVRPRLGAVEVAGAERLHRPRQFGERAGGQARGGGGDLLDRRGDDARQHQADGDREDRDRHEDVLEQRDQGRLARLDRADRQQVAGAVERHHRDHRAGELEPERALDPRQAGAAAVGDEPPGVEHRAGVGQAERQQHGREAELLEAQAGGEQPHAAGADPEHDRPARGAVGPLAVGLVAAQQQDRDRGQADADQIGEVRRRDHPRRDPERERADGQAGGQQRRDPRRVIAVAVGPGAREQPVLGELGERARGAGQRLQRAHEHVGDQEPDRRGLGAAREQRSEGRAEAWS